MNKKVLWAFVILGAAALLFLSWAFYRSLASPYKQGPNFQVPKFSLSGNFNKLIAVLDLNGDGREDFIIGGSGPIEDKTPIRFIISRADGSFFDATSQLTNGEFSSHNPFGVTADFNRDGVLDIAVFDSGPFKDQHESDDYGGGYEGGVAHLFLSQPGGTWIRSPALEEGAKEANSACAPFCKVGGTLHVVFASVGDVNGDGRPDIFVESGGGYRSAQGHFLISSSRGQFNAETSYPFYDEAIRWGPSQGDNWRWASNAIFDIDGDGHNDLILGRLAKPNNRQDDMRNSVVFNNGKGYFLSKNRVALPQPNWNGGWTYVKAIAVADITGDGLLDIALAHERSNTGRPNDNTGRYIQILINQGNRKFSDETLKRIGMQSTETAEESVFGRNYATPEQFLFQDVDGDGDLDLVAARSSSPMGSDIPYLYLNDGTGSFAPDASDPPFSKSYSEVFLLDINGDKKTDLVLIEIDNGPDGQFGTADDITIFHTYFRK